MMKNISTLFTAPRGMAVFMATLILLSLAVLSLSTMNRVSESSYLAGEAIEKKVLSIHAESAMRVALAEINERVFNDVPPAEIYKINGGTDDTFKVFFDKGDVANPVPLFAYRAHGVKIAQGPDNAPPGIENTMLAQHTYCYDIVIDTRELVKGSGTNIQGEMGVPLSGYFFGQAKSVGATSCFRKR